MIKMSATLRTQDDYGNGSFGAPRGTHTHQGIDFMPQVHAVSAGKVTKIGYPYGDDLSYRYVQITDLKGLDVRYFYINPGVEKGDEINAGQVIGTLQDLGKRYPNITPHFHFEVKLKGKVVDPNEYLRQLK